MKPPFTKHLAVLLLALAPALPLEAADPQPLSAAEQLKQFHLPPGFEIQLVASEPEIQKPINLNFDGAGRIWVTGSKAYPWPASTDANGQPIADFEKTWKEMTGAFRTGNKAPEPMAKGQDSVRVLSELGPDGRARNIRTFADRLNIPTGIQPLPRQPGVKGDTAIVYSIPNIWRMEDTDGDGHAEKREVLYGPFGFVDTHGGSSSYHYWRDGWVYGTHGFRNKSQVKDRAGNVTTFESGNTYRFRPDGSKIEYWSHGQTNPFGLSFDPMGNLYSADCHSKPVYMLLRGGYYEGINRQHDGLGFAPGITNDDHGSSGICGLAYYSASQFPAEYRDNLFVGNCVTRRINRDTLQWTGATPKVIRQPDFLTCDDPWFRPVDVRMGPDGALYVADFYNYIIGHYEDPLTDPRRDHDRGRIWRIVWKGDGKGAPATAPNLPSLASDALVQKLGDENLLVRTMAVNEWVARQAASPSAKPALAPAVAAAWARPASPQQHTGLLWTVARLELARSPAEPKFDLDALAAVVRHAGPQMGAEVFKLMAELPASVEVASAWSTFGTERPAGDASLQRAAAEYAALHPNPKGLSAALRALSLPGSADPELTYARRAAVREILKHPEGYDWAARLKSEQEAEVMAEISLAVPGKASAEYLLGHVQRTKMRSARAGDYLRHVALNLPEGAMQGLVDMLQNLDGTALGQRLTVADGLNDGSRKRGNPLPANVATWVQATLVEALSSGDAGILDRAIASVREMKDPAKVAPLQRIVLDKAVESARRAAALESLANIEGGFAIAAQALADPSSMTLRKRAATLLGAPNTRESRDALQNALITAPWDLATSIGAAMAGTDEGCQALLGVIQAGRISPALLRNKPVAAAVEKRPDPFREQVAELVKDLPPEDARLDGVIAQRVDDFRKHQAADLTHGAQVFQQQCAACHKLKNLGGNVGPNLDGVALRGPHRLMEDILDPNRNVDPAFRQTVIETADGRMLAGVNVRKEGGVLLLNDATGQEITVREQEVKSQTASRLSLMPPTFEQTLSGKDLGDLLSYLLGS